MSTPSFFAAIDLKSFYASVECVERGLDPLTTNLVVADFLKLKKRHANTNMKPVATSNTSSPRPA